MTKLTTNMRDTIVENALKKAGIYAKQREYAERRKLWAEKVADESVGGPDAVAILAEANKKVAKIVASLPEQLRTDVTIGPSEGWIYASFGGMRTSVREWDGTRPAKSGLMLSADHPLTIEFETLEAERKELSNRKDKLKYDVRAIISSVTTVNRLTAVWPESVELLPAVAAPKMQLPAVQIEAINAAIGLPSEETKQ